jgi:flagellar biosynthesis/type III secretory pathway protein FliH
VAVGRDLQRKYEYMGHDAQDRNERESAKSHQASVEIADALAKMFAELKPKIMAKYSIADEQIILLAIAKAAAKLGTNTMPAGSLTPDQTERLERKLQSTMLNAFMFGEIDDQ